MNLTIAAFGKLKTPGLRETADYYRKLLAAHVSADELELKPIAVPDKSPATRSRIQLKEAQLLDEKLAPKLASRGALILLDERGKAWSTDDWVTRMKGWRREGVPALAFCVGSSLGFDDSVRKRAQATVSLGPQTLSHELARVVLLEQLYRALSVIAGHPYHVAGS